MTEAQALSRQQKWLRRRRRILVTCMPLALADFEACPSFLSQSAPRSWSTEIPIFRRQGMSQSPPAMGKPRLLPPCRKLVSSLRGPVLPHTYTGCYPIRADGPGASIVCSLTSSHSSYCDVDHSRQALLRQRWR